MSPTHARRAPSPSELVLIDSLLSFLSRRVQGALDLGLVLLVDDPPPRPRYRSFLSEHVAVPMQAAALMLRLAVAEVVPEPSLTALAAVSEQAAKFAAALTELADFDTLAGAELATVVDRLTAARRRLRESMLDVGERLCFEPTILVGTSAERERFGDDVLARLCDDLLQERRSPVGPPPDGR